MTHRTPTALALTLLSGIAIGITAPIAEAQSLDCTRDPDAPEPRKAQINTADPDHLLSGPKVSTVMPDGMRNPEALGLRRAGSDIPYHVAQRALERLEAEETPPAFALSAAQRNEIERIRKNNTQARRVYDTAHGGETKQLRRQLEAARATVKRLRNPETAQQIRELNDPKADQKEVRKPEREQTATLFTMDQMDAMSPLDQLTNAESEVGRIEARLREIRAARPVAQDTIRPIWGILQEHQRGLAERYIDEEMRIEEDRRVARVVERQRQQREKERIEQLTELTGAESMDAIDAMSTQAMDALDMDAIPPRLRERLSKLPPERRAAAIARLLRAEAAKAVAQQTRGAPQKTPSPAAPSNQSQNTRQTASDLPTQAERNMANRQNRRGQKPPPSMQSVPLPRPNGPTEETKPATANPPQ